MKSRASLSHENDGIDRVAVEYHFWFTDDDTDSSSPLSPWQNCDRFHLHTQNEFLGKTEMVCVSFGHWTGTGRLEHIRWRWRVGWHVAIYEWIATHDTIQNRCDGRWVVDNLCAHANWVNFFSTDFCAMRSHTQSIHLLILRNWIRVVGLTLPFMGEKTIFQLFIQLNCGGHTWCVYEGQHTSTPVGRWIV